jgi:hypothetical protein
MYFNSNDILELDEDKAIKFLELKIRENNYLEYKSQYENPDKNKRDFLKDITAFANANGGTIVIGVNEPNDNIDLDSQVVGIQNAGELAQILERSANATIDPRISGLKFKPIKIKNKEILFIHIPLSLYRPHMLKYDKHIYFQMRHFESSEPMTIHEIRSSVMESISSEARVQKFLEDREYEIKREVEFINQPLFQFQLVPLIQIESNIDVFDKNIQKIFLEDHTLGGFSLFSGISPKPTLYGISIQDERQNPKWKIEIFKRGYISLWYKNESAYYNNNAHQFYTVHSGFMDFFNLFFRKIDMIMSIFKIDVPYIVQCRYYAADKTRLFADNYFQKFSDFYEQSLIQFPDHFRNTGESFQPIGKEICLELFNAYGFKNIIV